jgi:2,3-bisphosphoglycerate-dependent phosphoglycerate mutase
MKRIVLIRHGESQWNKENRFTGWTDVRLCSEGEAEAKRAGKLLGEQGFLFDCAFTSRLQRAIKTLDIVLEELDQSWIDVEKSWLLNERHYGALQGLNKADTAAKYGDEQVKIWRRSYAVRPPELVEDDPRSAKFDRRYSNVAPELLPRCESLFDTVARVVPYWQNRIVPQLQAGRQIIIAAHGNSLRALVKHLDDISDDEIVELNIPTGVPLVYEFSDELKLLGHYYLKI